ncbi:unnamed protein product [Brachionus calyciflorus]|uniref:Ferritin n=1 Tax=Brachionus calyciflorus TaxID=104777 RepID=A0A814GTJ0_9BILA|nr:unnamed protein product [Brachionus calyciflorus]
MLIVKIVFTCLLIGLGSAVLQSRSRQIFSCDDVLNKQIALEFNASQTYLSLSVKESWKEELGHAEKLIDYGVMRGAKVEVPALMKPDHSKWGEMSVCEVLELSLELEKKVNEHLHEIVKCANESKDIQLGSMIEDEFIDEQYETNKFLAELLTKIERNTMQLLQNGTQVSICDGYGLTLVDKELLKSN